jgi:peptidoglycan/xylan/chitin deacetylase (PgdA/CDA1 family)
VCVLAACGTRQVPTADAPARAVPGTGSTMVSLTFDDANENQWRYAVPQLRAHHMTATFYVITTDTDGPHMCCMSWAQLRTLQADGDDVGSHTATHPYLTKISPAQLEVEACGSRRHMLSNGIRDPQSFAYPYGVYTEAAERVVKNCGYTNARVGGGVSLSNTTPGPPYTEQLPPKDAYAVRTIAVDGSSPIQLADLQHFVMAAATSGGGWLPITFHQVCNAQAFDYADCMASYGPIQDTVFARFLNWLESAGHRGGAPDGVVVKTMRQAMTVAG